MESTINFMKHCPINEAYQFTSPLISVETFREQCTSQIGQEIFLTLNKPTQNTPNTSSKKEEVADKIDEKREEFSKLLHTDKQTICELEEVCSIDHLKCDYDDDYDYNKLRAFEDFPDNTLLQTVRLVKQLKTKSEELYYAPSFVEQFTEEQEKDDLVVSAGEVIIHVAIYHAEKRKPQQEYYVLSSQKLTELRDLIVCPADNAIFGEFSNNPDLTGVKSSKELTCSSFFFIEHCFYNDSRNQLNRDYSKVIIEWAKASERYAVPGLGLFQSSVMQDTTFNDLKIRLGYPYLFCHQGNCEHLVVFSDMRIITENDPRKISSYPFKISEVTKRHKRCSICKIHLIKWMTVNDSMAFEDPSFFCERCFHYLHYTKDGQKIATFEAYPYTEQGE